MKGKKQQIRINQCIVLAIALFCYLVPGVVNAQLKAGFKASVTAGCSPLVVKFNDNSTGGPTSWFWDLGKNTSTDQNPSAIYIDPGTYSIKLIIKNSTGADSIIKTDYITVYEKPLIFFDANITRGCAPLDVVFTDTSLAQSGDIAQRIWDFGDGTSSGEQAPSHTYNIADTFNVALTVTNSFGCSQTLVKPTYIEVANQPVADFSYQYTSICTLPSTFKFKNLTSADPAFTYQWYFGDGGSSTQANPKYDYSTAGKYDIQLIATNTTGCVDTITKSIAIGTQSANIIMPAFGCVNKAIVMQDSSQPEALSGAWDFGDGFTGAGLTVTHNYTAPGNYTVTYTASFGDCSGEIKKIITIKDAPVAAFSSPDKLTSCTAPFQVSFVNESSGADSYLWDFGDGAISTDQNPTHTYLVTGVFTVKLLAFNNAGACADTYIIKNMVNINPPNIEGFVGLPISTCVPATINFDAVITTPEPVTGHQWFFGNGVTSTEANPVYTYDTAGEYSVKLIITTASGCSDTFELEKAVIATEKPTARFTAFPTNTCAYKEVQFADGSSNDVIFWDWNFGDGGTSIEQNPLHHYLDTGYFRVQLIVANKGCKDSLIIPDFIYIKPPVARYITNFNCNKRFVRTFKDFSVAPQTWHWDFGDSTTSVLQNPSHTYANQGVYNVQLIVTNGGCSDTLVTPVTIIDANPGAEITALHSNFCKYDSIQLTATNYDPAFIKSFKWNFGDGSIADFSPFNSVAYHVYKQSGTYAPFLVTNDLNGCNDTAKIPNTIVNIYGPTALFTNDQGNCIDSLIKFKDQSKPDITNAITTWIWNYGDGITDTLTQPPFEHNYFQSGLFTPILKVIDANGCYDSLIKPDAVIITKPIANFSLQDSIRCAIAPAEFVDSSNGLSLNYLWDFGDGLTSGASNPKHLYAMEGEYDVSLTITDRFGCKDSITKTGIISVSNPVAQFSVSDSAANCPPLPVQTTNLSTSITSSFWDFGDGNSSNLENPFRIYNEPGIYTMQLIVHGYGPCYDTATKVISLKGPAGSFTHTQQSNCFPVTVNFKANTKNTIAYTWDFGDGALTSTTADSVSYDYKSPGVYIPRLIIEDIGGCQVALESIDTIKILGVNPAFEYFNSVGCDSSAVVFADSSKIASVDQVISRVWDFGDGNQSTAATPLHYYTNVGTYTSTLTFLTQKGCSGTASQDITILINQAPLVNAQIPDTLCLNATGNFTAQEVANIPEAVSWLWNFGNNSTDANPTTTYAFTTAGLYNVSIQATATTGCADTITKQLRVLPAPPVFAGSDTTVCKFVPAILHPSGAIDYVWNADAFLNCSNCANPQALPDSTRIFIVTGTDQFGCTASDSVQINIVQPVYINLAASGDTLCQGNSVQLNASGASFYSWQPVTGLNSASIANPIASPSGSIVYTVIGSSDINNCFTDTATVNILVAPNPVFSIKDTMVTINVGSSYTILTDNSADINQWSWLPPAGLSCSNCPQPVAQPKASISYQVEVANQFGCKATGNIRFEVICNNTNIFIPNTFSPNADGVNDYFYPRGKGLYTLKSIRIFNRWGGVVFAGNNILPESEKDGWNGKVNNMPQPSDVYVYVIEVLCDNGTVLNYKGSLTLIR